jgi:hypothetical protein
MTGAKNAKITVALVMSLVIIYMFWGLYLFDTDASWFKAREGELKEVVFAVIPASKEVRKEMEAKRYAWEFTHLKTPEEIEEIVERGISFAKLGVPKEVYEMMNPKEQLAFIEDSIKICEEEKDAVINFKRGIDAKLVAGTMSKEEYELNVERCETTRDNIKKKQKYLKDLKKEVEPEAKDFEEAVKEAEIVQTGTFWDKIGYGLSKPFMDAFSWIAGGLKSLLEPVFTFFDSVSVFFGNIWSNILYIWEHSLSFCSATCGFMTFNPKEELTVFGSIEEGLLGAEEQEEFVEIPEILRLGMIVYVGIVLVVVVGIPVIEHLPIIGGK